VTISIKEMKIDNVRKIIGFVMIEWTK